MRTLIYKRTHPGDPDAHGHFGIHDCMGQVRSWNFDSVIGVGGIGAEPSSHGLDGKINWIGIGARKHERPGARGPLVTFSHFVLYEDKGRELVIMAPTLARRLYGQNVRALLHDLSAREEEEMRGILALATDAPPSSKVRGKGIFRHGLHTRETGCKCRECSARSLVRHASGRC